MAEGTSLLRKHTGLNLYRGFESHRLRQDAKRKPSKDGFFFVCLIEENGENVVQ